MISVGRGESVIVLDADGNVLVQYPAGAKAAAALLDDPAAVQAARHGSGRVIEHRTPRGVLWTYAAEVQLAGGIPFVSDADLEEALDEAGLSSSATRAALDANAEARITGLRKTKPPV